MLVATERDSSELADKLGALQILLSDISATETLTIDQRSSDVDPAGMSSDSAGMKLPYMVARIVR